MLPAIIARLGIPVLITVIGEALGQGRADTGERLAKADPFGARLRLDCDRDAATTVELGQIVEDVMDRPTPSVREGDFRRLVP